MRSISYRTKQRLAKTLRILLILLAFLVVFVILAVIYLGRYVVYTPDGAHLDFGRNTALGTMPPAAEEGGMPPIESIRIDYADPNTSSQTAELLSGYYIDQEMLADPDAVLQAIRELDAPCTVMIDLKAKDGSFFYSTGIEGAKLAENKVSQVDKIISTLKNRGFTMIARVESFQDSAFALEHLNCGLSIQGGALWVGNGSYWLDPANETVISYLKQIARDLAGKGFKEIVFDHFYFPESNYIVYDFEKTRAQLIANTATELLNFFASSNITISFGNLQTPITLNDASHIFIDGATGSNLSAIVHDYSGLDDTSVRLVFLTGSKDNRFDGYQILRPLLAKLAG